MTEVVWFLQILTDISCVLGVWNDWGLSVLQVGFILESFGVLTCSNMEPFSETNVYAATVAAMALWASSWALYLYEIKSSSNTFLTALFASLKDLNACAEPESEIIY